MARLFDDAASEAIEIDQAVVTAAPFTISAWMRSNDINPEQTIFFLGDKDFNNRFWTLRMRSLFSGSAILWFIRDRGQTTDMQTTTDAVVGTWHHVCAVEAAADDHAVFIDGGSKGSSTDTNDGPAGSDRMSIGRMGDSSPSDFFSGDLGHIAIYSVGLTDQEVATLAQGISPLRVRRGSLVAYWPMNGISPELDVLGGLNMALIGTPSKSEEPPIPWSIVAPG